MGKDVNSLVKDLMYSIRNVGEGKTYAYDSIATVRRIADGIAWVHFAGGTEETPARLTINAQVGDEVQVRVSDGVAFLVGNVSSPPTDDSQAVLAQVAANQAMSSANIAFRAARQAVEDAATASDAASRAQADATTANEAATRALADAATAKESADQAVEDAATAQASADSAVADAATAKNAAARAETSAAEAKQDATRANTAANNALTQLSYVEDVVGVLTWISEHGEYALTTDTEVVSGKMYFTRDGDDYLIVTNPASNPSEAGYYELTDVTEAVSNYISSHLALTNEGLWVVKDNNGYKALLANDGMRIYDPAGVLVSIFGESIEFASERPQRIGGTEAYVQWYDSDNDDIADSLQIVGANITIAPGDSIDAAIQNAKTEAVQAAENAQDTADTIQTDLDVYKDENAAALTTINNIIASLEELTNDYQFLRSYYLTFNPDPEDQSGGLKIGGINQSGGDSPFSTVITNTQMSFLQNDEAISYINGLKYHIRNGEIEESLTVGPFEWRVEEDSLNLVML